MPKTYTTRQGDTWDIIAYRLWGKETLFHHLAEANPDHLGTLIFAPDIQLVVPDISMPLTTPSTLPPWMGNPVRATGTGGSR